MKSKFLAQEHKRKLGLERERHKEKNDIKKDCEGKEHWGVDALFSLMIRARREPLWTPLWPFEFPKRQRNSQPHFLTGCPVEMVYHNQSQINLNKQHHSRRSNTDAKSKWLLQFWCFHTHTLTHTPIPTTNELHPHLSEVSVPQTAFCKPRGSAKWKKG